MGYIRIREFLKHIEAYDKYSVLEKNDTISIIKTANSIEHVTYKNKQLDDEWIKALLKKLIRIKPDRLLRIKRFFNHVFESYNEMDAIEKKLNTL